MRSISARITVFLIVAACFLPAQEQHIAGKPEVNEVKGIPPRATPGDYPAQSVAGTVTIAAEFMGHSVPRVEGPLSTDDYVVVETGIFGPAGARIQLSAADFSLRVNGKKTLLSSQPFGFVVGSLKDPSYVPPEAPEEKSKGGLSTGGNSQSGPPPPVRMPFELQRSMAVYVQKSVLPEGDRALPQAGLIFFTYRSRIQSIHKLELIYSGSADKTTLELHP